MITLNKKKIPSVQQWDLLGMKYTDAWSRALPPVQAKQSMYEAETIDQSCLRESNRNDFLLCEKKKKKRQNGHHFVVETSA